MIPRNHALQQPRDGPVKHQEPTFAPVGKAAGGLSGGRGANVPRPQPTSPVSGSTAVHAFY